MIHYGKSLFVLLGILTSAAAQILLKIGSSSDIYKMQWFLYLFVSLFFYAISFLSYYLALRYYDISKIGPVMMISVVSLVTLYGFYAGEPFSFLKLTGIILAIVSIIIITQ